MNLIYNIIITPIVSIVDWVFIFCTNKIPSIGIIGAVVAVSLAINFLALPLYNIADLLQEKERNIAKSLAYRVKKIKKTFKGDEQFMILSEYYRQNNYHPLYVLRSSLSILIEIPFFIAAYQYLSHNELLSGASFMIFKDLGSPDKLFSIHLGTFILTVNVLPIFMTLINFISGAIYLRDAPAREKVQLYGLAVVFLVLLYYSPSGLVIYWILNNIFSLIKNIVMKTKYPARIAHIFISIILTLFVLYLFSKHGSFVKKGLFALFDLFIIFLPAIAGKAETFQLFSKISNDDSYDKIGLPLLIVSGLGLALLLGFTLPANVIATSPVEFSFLGTTDSPVNYVWSSLWVFLGFFVFWPLAIYKMFGSAIKKILPPLLFVFFICALANVFIFKYNYGNLSVSFTLSDDKVLKNYSLFYSILPLLFFAAVLALYFCILKFKKQNILVILILSICLAETGMGIYKIDYISKVFAHHSQNFAKAHHSQNFAKNESKEKDYSGQFEKIYNLSKTQKNVIVLFLDRAINAYFPEMLNQFPELQKQFEGFVYYPNTLSFSTHTTVGAPAMMGGYEYSPEEFNKRPKELLKDKHNEASLVLPKLFADAGYKSTVTDPPWGNYAHEGDLSAFDGYKNIQAYSTFGKYTDLYFKEIGLRGGVAQNNADIICRKEVRNFSVIQVMYPLLRSTFYGLCIANNQKDDRNFYDIFSSLYFLSEQTDFTSDSVNYFFIDNDTPHEPHAIEDDFLRISSEKVSIEKAHYEVNVAAFIQVGKYLDFLRKNDAFDNTRIIIVSDHGNSIKLKDFESFGDNQKTPASFTAMLLCKDFNATGAVKTDTTFMMNADTLFLAKKNLNLSNINPFTHKELTQNKENGVTLFPLYKNENHGDQLLKRTQFTLEKNKAWHVSDNIFDKNNWIPLETWETQTTYGEKK